MSKDVIEYIIKFLLGKENEKFSSYVSYDTCSGDERILIKASHFFDKDIYLTAVSMPVLPLCELEGTPILFGTDKIVREGEKIVLEADIVASTFFMITRYEEYVCKDNRDKYGRYMGKGSFMYKAGYIERPIVEEYGIILKKLLAELGFPVIFGKKGFTDIFLTHDVDQIWQWNSWGAAIKTMVKRCLCREKNRYESIKARYDYKKYDNIYTFPWLIELDSTIKKLFKKTRIIYFFMGCKHSKQDFGYIIRKQDVKELISYLGKSSAEIGFHVSYQAGENPQKIPEELKRIKEIENINISTSRYHYLANRKPEDYKYLIENGITEDFTMGYADVIGFRLGTCRMVHWISPVEKEVSNLVLHPLTVMDVELDGYMDLNEQEAFKKVCDILESIYRCQGEVTLLWHNTSVKENGESYHRDLYSKIITFLENKLMSMEEEE